MRWFQGLSSIVVTGHLRTKYSMQEDPRNLDVKCTQILLNGPHLSIQWPVIFFFSLSLKKPEILFTMNLNCNIIGCWWNTFYCRMQNITFKSFFHFSIMHMFIQNFHIIFMLLIYNLKKKEIDFIFLYFITRVQQSFLVFHQHIY